MTTAAVPSPDLVAVVVHSPATNPLVGILWDLGLRPLPATSGPTVWVAARPTRQDVQP